MSRCTKLDLAFASSSMIEFGKPMYLLSFCTVQIVQDMEFYNYTNNIKNLSKNSDAKYKKENRLVHLYENFIISGICITLFQEILMQIIKNVCHRNLFSHNKWNSKLFRIKPVDYMKSDIYRAIL